MKMIQNISIFALLVIVLSIHFGNKTILSLKLNSIGPNQRFHSIPLSLIRRLSSFPTKKKTLYTSRLGSSRQIQPLTCTGDQVKNETGICMFAWYCVKEGGVHLGTCIDRFYFGSCCKLPVQEQTSPNSSPTPSLLGSVDSTATLSMVDTLMTNMLSVEIEKSSEDIQEYFGNSKVNNTAQVSVEHLSDVVVSTMTTVLMTNFSKPQPTKTLNTTINYDKTTSRNNNSSTIENHTLSAETSSIKHKTTHHHASLTTTEAQVIMPIVFSSSNISIADTFFSTSMPTIFNKPVLSTASEMLSSFQTTPITTESHKSTSLVALVTSNVTHEQQLASQQMVNPVSSTQSMMINKITIPNSSFIEYTITANDVDNGVPTSPDNFAVAPLKPDNDYQIEIVPLFEVPEAGVGQAVVPPHPIQNDNEAVNISSMNYKQACGRRPWLDVQNRGIIYPKGVVDQTLGNTKSGRTSQEEVRRQRNSKFLRNWSIPWGSRNGKIVNGETADYGEWPWQASLRQRKTGTYLHKCGCTLLNQNWAITAAHCVENVSPDDLSLRLGEYDLNSIEEPHPTVDRRVQIVASHPKFDPKTFEYDMALLRFYEPVTFQPNIVPICIPQTDELLLGQTAWVTGWGRLYDGGPLPSVMQEVDLPIFENSKCEEMYKKAGYVEHIPNIFICAGYAKGGKDSCEGDSGGPMVVMREDGRFMLSGVISWGIGCAEKNQPGVYTRISKFSSWIEKILQF